MKTIVKLIFAILSIIYISTAHSADVAEQTICAVQMDVGGRIVIATCTPWVSKSTCTSGWVQWFDAPDKPGPGGMHAIKKKRVKS